ncbi:MAG: hypothetical protein Q7J84_07975 [Sulfuricaulis sp.]|nr:hypothetical protein [Sulfuricaulis sp.]
MARPGAPPRCNDHDLVGALIAWEEADLCIAVMKVGGICRPRQKIWELSWISVIAPGIGRLIVPG